MENLKITKTTRVVNKSERLALRPKLGWIAVQRDRGQRYFFDGERWRLYLPGTKRHWRDCGKPVSSNSVFSDQLAAKKKRNIKWVILAVVLILIISGFLLIN